MFNPLRQHQNFKCLTQPRRHLRGLRRAVSRTGAPLAVFTKKCQRVLVLNDPFSFTATDRGYEATRKRDSHLITGERGPLKSGEMQVTTPECMALHPEHKHAVD